MQKITKTIVENREMEISIRCLRRVSNKKAPREEIDKLPPYSGLIGLTYFQANSYSPLSFLPNDE